MWAVKAGRWSRPPHLLQLDRALIDVVAGRLPRLIVTMPPQHGKSEEVSCAFPAWTLAAFPTKKIILSSYQAQYAAHWGGKARELFEDEVTQQAFGTRPKHQIQAANWWFTEAGGYMATAGALGPITGKGADIFLIDDPVKNPEDVASAEQREKLWDWAMAVMRTRLQPRGAVVLVMTRWHEDDLAGRLLTRQRDRWKLLSFPAIAEEADGLGRQPGDALWEERYSAKELTDVRDSGEVSPYWWSAIYQQTPTPAHGAVFDRAGERRFFTEDDGETYVLIEQNGDQVRFPRKQLRNTIVVADLAISESEAADFTVFATWTWTGVGPEPWRGKMLLLDLVRMRLQGPDQLPLLMKTMAENKAAYALLESVQYQATLVQYARRAGLNAREAPARGDKVTRAQPAAAKWAHGDVYLPRNASWSEVWLQEHQAFPKGTHDDMVDTTAYAAIEFQKLALTSAETFAPMGVSRVSPWMGR